MLTRRHFVLGAASFGLAAPAFAQDANRFTAFFTGRVTGEGTTRNLRSGVTRGVKAVLNGRPQGDVFLLRQDVTFSDGERRIRQWRFRRSPNGYVGVAQDVIGEAGLVLSGEGARLTYKARMTVDGATHDLNFDETMRFAGANRVTNSINVKFWMLSVAELQLTLQKRA
jgi:hypothetical protein